MAKINQPKMQDDAFSEALKRAGTEWSAAKAKTSSVTSAPSQTLRNSAHSITNDNPNTVSPGPKTNDIRTSEAAGDDYNSMYKNLLDQQMASRNSSINSSANNQLAVISQNLAKTLAALESEKGTVKPNYDKSMNQISNNQFATTETQKELMNMSGWNTANSGLAVGEVGKIAVGADKQRADVNANLVQAMNDIQKRMTDANTYANQDTANIERQRQDALASASADAAIYADQTAYERMRNLLSDKRYDTEFAYQQSRDAKSDQQYQQQFDYQKTRDLVNDKNEQIKFDYQKDRDKISDSQWLKQFNEQTRQSLVQEAISRGNLSVSQGNLALSKARQAYEISKDQKSTAESNTAKAEAAKKQEVINLALQSMMSSSNPSEWIKSKIANGSLMSDEAAELINLYNKYKQNSDGSATLTP